MTAFVVSLLRVSGVLAVASAVGWLAAGALVPRDRVFRLERLAWGVAVGMALLAAFVPLSFLVRVRPGWISFSIVAAVGLAVSLKFRVSSPESESPHETGNLRLGTSFWNAILWLLILLGVSIYAFQALTEPMWSNDFIAIWGLKGKVIYLTGELPGWLRGSPGFAHPEYPLGLPFLYAGISFLTGRWDDHAMAVVFPLTQAATLAAAIGWLRRRGASERAALCAAAILGNFEPLYSGSLAGLAEVPLASGLLLFGTALSDALDRFGSGPLPGSLRRLALAAAFIAATKNEGVFFAAVGCAAALALGGRRRWRIAAAALPTALIVHFLHVAWRGRLPLRDFDFASFSVPRLVQALSAAARVVSHGSAEGSGPEAWIGLLLVGALVLLGRRAPEAVPLWALAAAGLAAYLVLPAFAVRGPDWLVQTTLVRIASGLAPLVAAAVALRWPAAAGLTSAPAVDPADA